MSIETQIRDALATDCDAKSSAAHISDAVATDCDATSSAAHIREAVATDCDAILALIQELAAFEQMPDQVAMTAEKLKRDGFPENDSPKFLCLVAEVDGKVVGYALFYPTYSTWKGPMMFMEDLYVTPSHRRRGIGTALWRQVTVG